MRKRSWTKRNILQIPTLTVATLAVLCGLLVATAGGSPPVSAQDADGVVWDAQMRVGDIGDHGLGDGSSSLGWGAPTVGSITPGTFSHHGDDYTVTHLYHKTSGTIDAGNIRHTLHVDAGKELPSDFKLVVSGNEFMVSDASFHAHSHVYTWDTIEFGWAVGQNVNVQLKDTDPEFWVAEMTVGVREEDGVSGFTRGLGSLNPQEFVVNGEDQYVSSFYEYEETLSGKKVNDLVLIADERLPEGFIITIGGRDFRTSDLDSFGAEFGQHRWRNTASFNWSEGDTVAITLRASPQAPSEPEPEPDETLHTVWDVNMTVGEYVISARTKYYGYGPRSNGHHGSLPSTSFTHEGTTYTISRTFHQTRSAGDLYRFTVDGVLPDGVLTVGGREFLISDATTETVSGQRNYLWSTSDFGWEVDDVVPLRLELRYTDSLGPNTPWTSAITVGSHQSADPTKTGYYGDAANSAISGDSFVYEAFEYTMAGVYQEKKATGNMPYHLTVEIDRTFPDDTFMLIGERGFPVSGALHIANIDGSNRYVWTMTDGLGWAVGDSVDMALHLDADLWATPEVTFPADGVFWDAQMTVIASTDGQRLSGLLGGLFNLGSITPNSFSFLNEDYTVEDLFQNETNYGTDENPDMAGYLSFGKFDELPDALTLVVGSREFRTDDAAYEAEHEKHVWNRTAYFGWANNEQVAVQLKVTEDPTPPGTQKCLPRQ